MESTFAVQLGICNTDLEKVFYINNQRITEPLGLEGTFGDHIVQHLFSEQDQLKQVGWDSVQSCLSILNDGESTTSLGSLCQCLTAHTVKTPVFLLFKQNSLCFDLCSLLHVLPLGTTGPVSSFFTLHRVFIHIDKVIP